MATTTLEKEDAQCAQLYNSNSPPHNQQHFDQQQDEDATTAFNTSLQNNSFVSNIDHRHQESDDTIEQQQQSRDYEQQQQSRDYEQQQQSRDYDFSAAASQQAANLAVAANLAEAANFDANTNNSHDRDSDEVIEVIDVTHEDGESSAPLPSTTFSSHPSAASSESEHQSLPETPRKKSRPPIPAKPQSPIVKMRTTSAVVAPSTPYNSAAQNDAMPEPSRAASEPPADAAAIAVGAILTGGEPVSLPPQVGNSDSPMPELLSLKDRLQLFEKEIKQQTVPVEPKKDRKFSFLSEDELRKMKEEEAARIANMTRLDLETLDSLTSQISNEDASVLLDELEGGTVVIPPTSDQTPAATDEMPPSTTGDGGAAGEEESASTREARSAWRKERLRSLEEDNDQAQQIVDRITELSKYSEEDNGNYLESSKTAEILRQTAVATSGDDIGIDEADVVPAANNIDMETTETETESDVQTSTTSPDSN
eukprot:TRINITY_DN5397_c0_g1_i5.p1 TRINITY_DN5397_c0_g1~~TRINITY_DN5397_c0_g1_i5.p1  ORF type:complete len:520 (+),score=193.68 TRINITY_DN5397_c0_g1_i5:118-1560(+)